MEFCDNNNCVDCCQDAKVPLLNDDINRITSHGYYDVFFVDERKGIKLLRTRDDGSCVFFNKRSKGCEVYTARPERCRLNPYCICESNLDPHVDEDCKHSYSCRDNPKIVKRMHEYIATLQEEIEWRRRTGNF